MKTNLIDEMATALLMALDTMYDGKTPKTCKIVQQALTRYEAEKDNYTTKVSGNELLLEKTQEWHDHGAVAPSCVGCPTAEVVIADGKYTRVITERLEECIVGEYGCPKILHGSKCPHDIMNQDDEEAVCKACWLAYLKGEDVE